MGKGKAPGRVRYSWESRCRIVQAIVDGASPAAAAAAHGASRATGYRLWRRFREGGWEALRERPPISRHCPHRLDAEAEAQIVEARRQTGWGPAALGAALGRRRSTVWRVLKRHGLSRHERQPRPPANRYEYDQAGALLHLDAKKLGRFWRVGHRALGLRAEQHRNRRAGWQHAHVAVDDHSRLAICERLYPPRAPPAARPSWSRHRRVRRARHPHRTGHDRQRQRLRSRAFRAALQRHGIRHLRTRPYTPRTNGKAEAFIRILQREWACAFAYHSSAHRARALPGYIRWYNNHRPHGSLGGHPPINRVSQAAGSCS